MHKKDYMILAYFGHNCVHSGQKNMALLFWYFVKIDAIVLYYELDKSRYTLYKVPETHGHV